MIVEWDDAARIQAETAASSGNFVNLPDNGDKMVVAFVGKAAAKKVVFDQKMNQYREPKGDEKASSARWSINVYVLKATVNGKETEINDMKVWDSSNKTFAGVIAVRGKYGLDKKFFEVERHGKKDDTATTYSVLPDIDITPEMAKAIAGCKLHDLESSESGAQTDLSSYDKGKNGAAAPAPTTAPTAAAAPAPAQTTAAAAVANGVATIAKETAASISLRVKQLPVEKINAYRGWMESVGVKAVLQLPASQEKAAFQKLEELEGKAAPAEVDPFAV